MPPLYACRLPSYTGEGVLSKLCPPDAGLGRLVGEGEPGHYHRLTFAAAPLQHSSLTFTGAVGEDGSRDAAVSSRSHRRAGIRTSRRRVAEISPTARKGRVHTGAR
ncbi:unnamed protein product [Lota lota]